jgi:superfamily I DNA and/or RNA helicase
MAVGFSGCLGTVDVLFIDEAAQMSLANVIAVSQAANNIVLLGDPQQLEQPIQGSHPECTNVSSLHHILDGQQTIAENRGLSRENMAIASRYLPLYL